MNFYTAATKLRRAIAETARANELCGLSPEDAYAQAERMELDTFTQTIDMGIKMMMIYKERAHAHGLINDPAQKIVRTYFLTIRPDTSCISFRDFFSLTEKFVARACFLTFTLTFEQKGDSAESLGQGFHCHIIAEMKQRSKTEVLRDTVSTFKCCTSANCIQVDILKTKNDLENTVKYLTEYTSDDNHKIVTQPHDAAWREMWGLQHTYTEQDVMDKRLPSIKSDVGQAFSVKTLPVIIEMD